MLIIQYTAKNALAGAQCSAVQCQEVILAAFIRAVHCHTIMAGDLGQGCTFYDDHNNDDDDDAL